MKKILLLTAMLFVAAPKMQAKGDKEEVKLVLVKEENSDNYYYEGVVPVDSVSKEEMFKRAKDWVLSNFKTGDNNAQFDEQNLSIYNGSAVLLNGPDHAIMSFKVSIYFKDERYKFRFDNIALTTPSINGPDTRKYSPNMYAKIFMKRTNKICNEALTQLSTNLENAIKNGGSKKDDW